MMFFLMLLRNTEFELVKDHPKQVERLSSSYKVDSNAETVLSFQSVKDNGR
jgi:hypothetical protein